MTSLMLDAKGCAGGPLVMDVGTEVAMQVYVYMLHDFCLSERLMALCGWLDAGDAWCKGHAEGLDSVSDDGGGLCRWPFLRLWGKCSSKPGTNQLQNPPSEA